MNLFQWIFTTFCAIMAIRAMLRLWRRRVPRRSGGLATLLWTGATLAIAFPASTMYLAKCLGIGRGADLVLYLAILGGLAAGTYFYQRCRQLENLITEIVRRDAVHHAIRGTHDAAAS